MKTHSLVLLSLFAPLIALANPSNWTKQEAGPNHTRYTWTTTNILSGGRTVIVPHEVTAIASGLNRWNEGTWEPARVQLEIENGRAVSRYTQNRITFASSLQAGITQGALMDIELPEGRGHIKTRFRGVALYSHRTQESWWLAEAGESVGQVEGSDRVIYTCGNGPGEIPLKVEFHVTLHGVSQNILFTESLPSLADMGLGEDITEEDLSVEVVTEFEESPAVTVMRKSLALESDFGPGATDDTVEFAGAGKIGRGAAFKSGENRLSNNGVRVIKQLHRMSREDGQKRDFLFESVPLKSLRRLMSDSDLPQASVAPQQLRTAQIARKLQTIRQARFVPKAPGEKLFTPGMRMASSSTAQARSVIFDYEYVSISGNLDSLAFKSGKTYYIPADGVAILYGTSRMEPNTTVKYFSNATLYVLGELVTETDPHAPAVLTSAGDHSVGEMLVTGTTNDIAKYALYFDTEESGKCAQVQNLQIRNAVTAVGIYTGNSHVFKNVQISKVTYGFNCYHSRTALRNLLMHDLPAVAFVGSGDTNNSYTVEHGTFNNIWVLNWNATSAGFTNCILTAVGGSWALPGTNNAVYTSASGLFATGQSLGKYYLAPGNPLRGAGTTNINPALAAELRQRTVDVPGWVPPVSANTTWTNKVPRGTSPPSLGYHYAPIDVSVDQMGVTNATLTLQGPIVVATTHTNSAFLLGNNGSVVINGQPDGQVILCRINQVQEQIAGGSQGWNPVFGERGYSLSVKARFGRFTSGRMLIYGGAQVATLSLRDCDLNTSLWYNTFGGSAERQVGVTNCLFRGGNHCFGTGTDPLRLGFYNNLMLEGALTIDNTNFYGTSFSKVYDNQFDGTVVTNHYGSLDHGNNAYRSGASRLFPTRTSDVVAAAFSYETGGPLSWRYYQPSGSPLLNAGSRAATIAGLYHFTTTTNQVAEAGSTVDIGFHHVPLNASGQPVDSDADGLANWSEDRDGDGVKDSNETDWQDSDTDDDGVWDLWETVLGTNPIVSDYSSDTGNLINLKVFSPIR